MGIPKQVKRQIMFKQSKEFPLWKKYNLMTIFSAQWESVYLEDGIFKLKQVPS